ncbi:MAG: penicillin-binding protein 2 [Syntrophomonadaceae bacterium]|nr:penicillin-binding protein 2 [Syntrophomonadaceae bacterium]
MNTSDLKFRLRAYSYFVIALLVILGLRLAMVQLFLNDDYQTQAKDNRVRLVPVKAPRGEIYAADGSVLAANELVYTLSLSYLDKVDRTALVDKLVVMLAPYYPDIDRKTIMDKIELQKFRLFEPVVVMRDIPWELVVQLEEKRQDFPGLEVSVEPLRNYPEGALAGHALGYIHSISQEELNGSEASRYSINSLIGKAGIERQYEKELRGTNGARQVEVNVSGRPVRQLVTLQSHPGNNIYLTIDTKLQKVMEKSMAENLARLQAQNPKARVASAVVLNVKTGEVLAMASAPNIYPDDWKGNLKPVLASYYLPDGSYDPLNPGALTNRAIQTTYPPGSTFKGITGMSVLEKGGMDPQGDLVNCAGAYWIAPYIKCTGVHGNVNYYRAMAVSCNTYFQEMGRRAGKDEIIHVGKQFGLGSNTGIDLPYETAGLLPTPEWKKEISSIMVDSKYKRLFKELDQKYAALITNAKDEEEKSRLIQNKANERAILQAQYDIDYNFDTHWQQFDTFNMSIGQGSNEFTVIQLANYIATIANGGYLMQPHLVKKIVTHEGKVLKVIKPHIMNRADVSISSLAETRRAMLAVTQPGGTAYSLFGHFPPEIGVGAKTGTAETGRAGDNARKEFHGVFIAFAPADDPEIAFAGVVEYGYSGGGSAGYIARDVFEQYFGIVDHMAAIKADEKNAGVKKGGSEALADSDTRSMQEPGTETQSR